MPKQAVQINPRTVAKGAVAGRIGNQAAAGVTKDELSGQAAAILQNIAALVQEVQAEIGAAPEGETGSAVQNAEGGEGQRQDDQHRSQGAPDNAAPSVDDDSEDEYEMKSPDGSSHIVRLKKSIAKAIITGSPDASTGVSPEEERQEDLPEWDEENIDAVTKALVRLLGKQSGVQRAAPAARIFGRELATQNDQNSVMMAELLGEVAKELKNTRSQLSTNNLVIQDILEGLGVAKAIEEAPAPTPRKPVQTPDQGLVVKELLNALLAAGGGINQQAAREAPLTEQVHKNMIDLTTSLRQVGGDLWGRG